MQRFPARFEARRTVSVAAMKLCHAFVVAAETCSARFATVRVEWLPDFRELGVNLRVHRDVIKSDDCHIVGTTQVVLHGPQR